MNGVIRDEEIQSPFSYAISKIVVSQICESVGFKGAQKSALETLVDLATRYLQTLAKSASSYANSFNRTNCNLFDVIRAIEDLNSAKGFTGASDVSRPLMESGILGEIRSFVESTDEIPFARPIRLEKASRRDVSVPSFVKLWKDPPFSHVPSWLPVFPDKSSYRNGARVRVRVYEGEKKEEEEDSPFCDDEHSVAIRSADKGLNSEIKRVLPFDRPKVKFKLGLGFKRGVELGLRNGICRGGKRVSWHTCNEEERSLKRRRI